MNMQDSITFLTIKELSKYLHISEDLAYDLIHYEDFPYIRIGRKILVPQERLNVWLNKKMFTTIDLEQ